MSVADPKPTGGGTASEADKRAAGGKLDPGASAKDRAKNGAKVANKVAAKHGRGGKR